MIPITILLSCELKLGPRRDAPDAASAATEAIGAATRLKASLSRVAPCPPAASTARGEGVLGRELPLTEAITLARPAVAATREEEVLWVMPSYARATRLIIRPHPVASGAGASPRAVIIAGPTVPTRAPRARPSAKANVVIITTLPGAPALAPRLLQTMAGGPPGDIRVPITTLTRPLLEGPLAPLDVGPRLEANRRKAPRQPPPPQRRDVGRRAAIIRRATEIATRGRLSPAAAPYTLASKAPRRVGPRAALDLFRP